MRLAFVAPPFAGHLNPLVPLANAARGVGHTAAFVTGERKHAILRRHGFELTDLPALRGQKLEAIANWPSRVGGNPIALLAQLRQNIALLPAIRNELIAAWTASRPDLVIADSVAPIAGLVCGHLGIPWITTIATPFSIEQRCGTPAYLGGWQPSPAAWAHLRDATGRAVIHTFKRAVYQLFKTNFRHAGLNRLYRDDGEEAIYSPRALLGFGIEALEFPRDWPKSFQMIGPIVDNPEDTPPLVLPARPRVLLSLGTHLVWAKQTLIERATAVAVQLPNVHFVLSLGDPDNTTARNPAPNLAIHGFVSYRRDLKHFDAIVHHGGAGVTYAAILSGIPSLVVPHDYDQFDYAARIVYHGVGLRAKILTAAGIRQLLDGPWPALARLQAEAAAYRPAETFLKILSEYGSNSR